MRRTSPVVLLLVITAVAALVAGGMQLSAGMRYGLAITTWIESAAILFLAATILWLGNQVRLFQKGEKPNFDGIRAARTLALAKAGALTGAVLLGRYGAVVLVTLSDWAGQFGSTGLARRIVINAAVAALASLALIAAALLAEKWCELPPSKPETQIGKPSVALRHRAEMEEVPEATPAYRTTEPQPEMHQAGSIL